MFLILILSSRSSRFSHFSLTSLFLLLGYRAVMAENERLCNKLEHLEEIFVHQARPGGFGKGSNDSPKSGGSGGGSGQNNKLLRHLKAENSSLRVRLAKLENGSGGGGSPSKFINSNESGGSADDRKEKQDLLDLKGQNAQLQKRLEKYRKREMELLRALKAQQLRRSSAGSSGGGGVGSPLRQQSSGD
jgi:hypothetical protein